VFGVFVAGPARAQDPAQPPPPPPPPEQPTIISATVGQADDDARLRPMEPDYSLVNLPTTLPLPAHAGNFHLTHRFNENLRHDDFSEQLQNLFGLDQGANIGLEFRYGIMRRLEAIVQRTSISRTIQFSGKYDGWRQSASMPLSISAVVSVEGDNNFRQHYAPAVGAVLSRTIAQHLAVYVMPMWVHDTAPATLDTQDSGIIGVGARVRIRPTTYVIGEVTPRVGGYVIRDPEYGFGIEKRVGAHVFALTFTNNPGTTFRQIALGGNPATLNLGFNLTRKFF
jgi:hypothetical protein